MLDKNKWKWLNTETSHHRKMVKMKNALVKEAKGYTCKECKHLSYGYCDRHESLETGTSIICYCDSPVCFAFFQENCKLGDCD